MFILMQVALIIADIAVALFDLDAYSELLAALTM